jgi:DNA-binding transcriptional regulator YhcF (GntR family)
MEFKKNQSIYLQIADHICENIMTLAWPEGEKITSVRELAATIEVNPNTVMRAYAYLQEAGVIQNKRGIGYFVSPGASQNIKTMQRQKFIETELPVFLHKMQLLGIDMQELQGLIDKHYLSQDSKK